MAFGPIMSTTTDTGLKIEMAPFSREEATQFTDGFNRRSVTKFLNSSASGQTVETEHAWHDAMIVDKTKLVWGIWTIDGERKLIGSFELKSIDRQVLAQATNGIVIFDKSFWRKGIATAAHRAGLLYAFKQLGLVRIKSAVFRGNEGSFKSMEKSGFVVVYTERNTHFLDGKPRHQDNLECLNPDDWAWQLWWGDDRPTKIAVEAREITRQAIEWAERNTELL